MAAGQSFLHIPRPIADTAQIGPLVIPGKSPCIRCAELTQAEHNGIYGKDLLLNKELELTDYPIIAAHYVAAIAASLVAQFFDNTAIINRSHKEEVAGKVIFCNYQSPATSREVALSRHPLCGCAFH
jgi:bacteriocin biosynthesis cyclodehydratase domain-containing protein